MKNSVIGDREKAFAGERAENLLPRALTLTMFLRLFLADLFIHGLGGARYDKITDELIRRFFKGEPAKYTVASATLSISLHKDSCFSKVLALPSLHEVQYKIRRLLFNTQEFLPGDHDLVKELNKVIEEFKNAKGSRKHLHESMTSIRERMQVEIQPELQRVRDEKRALLANKKIYDVLSNRAYPYFFYDITALM